MDLHEAIGKNSLLARFVSLERPGWAWPEGGGAHYLFFALAEVAIDEINRSYELIGS